MEMSMLFSNLAQAIAEGCAVVNNLTTYNNILTEKVTLYTNHLSTKEANNMELQTFMKNLQG